MTTEILKLAAFSDGDQGGNPAGVWLGASLPDEVRMQQIAADVGFSETAFAAPLENGWRVRYFSPLAEVPFCGHATIALGAVLAAQQGDGVFDLTLNQTQITVEGHAQGSLTSAALQSPPTFSKPVSAQLLEEALTLFGYTHSDLDERIPPAHINGGAGHLILALNSRAALKAMHYDQQAGRELMVREGWATILLAWAETDQMFHTRNPFAFGGVYEDPATGAATAALGGYLRDIGWPHGGLIDILQGEDMGSPSRLRAEIPEQIGSSIRVSGMARKS
ncbi:PhzF family phenazine biosynthesis protein [Pseudomonas syringae group genomosp. 3]|uniref:PhzF family phenazine biosynthesis protein n=1 Tax=Pseudomonas syringae group genomosp. 3 TaxID=251701 RepID=UPI0006E4DA82|nr:PhzF family phenazine biosynthesis protein [Pseudomonas syringae group genomosp. 3]KPW58432.1 Phenazine biosynthesis family protein [Pseudomonas syringae pv. berberidis]KPY11933.1 Phenazine biosynthesis family protein [Pseudomonas syringae pv. philadelphi]RMM35880.1 Phenazine biosynthesis protein [Pseudomonas syringae pv. berberidis]RMP64064.1 Phenazine biosynthesis protein [Pseudomonas syringae pv. berberidis]RMQ37089.1 Phenazine biosynthesis protein [Pseudomonas syringae pv. berberidis]